MQLFWDGKLNAEEIERKARHLRQNAEFLVSLPSASSVELYDSGAGLYVPEDHSEAVHHGVDHEFCFKGGVVMDYYSLVGLNGDPNLVIPTPVLLDLFGVKTKRGLAEFGAWLRTQKLAVAHVDDRQCAEGRHEMTSQGAGFDPETGQRWCQLEVCRLSWQDGEQPPRRPLEFSELGLVDPDEPIVFEKLADSFPSKPVVC